MNTKTFIKGQPVWIYTFRRSDEFQSKWGWELGTYQRLDRKARHYPHEVLLVEGTFQYFRAEQIMSEEEYALSCLTL